MKALIGCNGEKSGSVELADRICGLLSESGITPLVWSKDCGIIGRISAEPVEAPKDCDFVVTVGGDGTILKWGKVAAEYDIPLLGVNMGRLGFMATVEPDEIEKIPAILMGKSKVIRRMMLDCELIRSGETVMSRRVINDVVLSRGEGSKLPEFTVFCGDKEVSGVRADGIILSTPTGSTAYSLAAGGPIISPDLECIEYTALSPHTLFNRPMLFSDKQVITASVNHYDGSRAFVSVDGSKGVDFLEGDIIRLKRHCRDLRTIEAGDGFYGAVHNKLIKPLK